MTSENATNVRLAILMAIALAPGLACYIGCGKQSDFEADAEPFDLGDLRWANHGADDAVERCDRLCSWATGDYVVEVHDCLLELEPGIDLETTTGGSGIVDTGLPENTLAGHVTCSGISERVCKGRYPLGVVLQSHTRADLAGTLARFAREERAAVVAFEQLADRLVQWGAPEDLVGRCRHAADQERLHALLMEREADARGVVVPGFEVDGHATLLELAINNVTEGCANESAASLLAHVLAKTAPTVSLREAFARIAVDEAGHAELSFDLHAWFLDQLGPADRSVLEDALTDALARVPEVLATEAATLPAELRFGTVDAARRAGEVLSERLATHG